ncbi:MAG: ORF6N domain-containing protein [Ruminococcus sp.]|nr:ORF6N domain-containing protein [Ruminococcus sp.]
MTELKLTPIENEGKRVLTTAQLAEAYGTDSKVISYNFNHNKTRYIEGKHFYRLTGEELKAIREIHELPKNINTLYLWTEKGA